MCGKGVATDTQRARPPDTRTPERAVITRLLPPYSPLALASTHIHNCADNAGPVPTTTTTTPPSLSLSLSVSRQHPSTPRSSLLSVYYSHNCRFHAYANSSPSLSLSLSALCVSSVCVCARTARGSPTTACPCCLLSSPCPRPPLLYQLKLTDVLCSMLRAAALIIDLRGDMLWWDWRTEAKSFLGDSSLTEALVRLVHRQQCRVADGGWSLGIKTVKGGIRHFGRRRVESAGTTRCPSRHSVHWSLA